MNLDKRKEHESREEERPRIQLDTKNLLNELALKISREYGIDISRVKEFITSKTGSDLNSLKSVINSQTGQEINIEELQSVIKGAKEVIEKASKEQIELLKGTITEEKLAPENHFYVSQKLLSQDMTERVYNPTNMGDHIVGAGVGIINSVEATVKLLYNIGSGVIQAPYHIYLIVSGKAEYDTIKRI